ncbi:DEAD/DEAH box helicase (plasmid) [Curtobacterium sp. TC1]|uniref:DEAD/DEAH box helicase n=1 Tax=Curtobacterium sp. TC1 TaxID=2862880 RepID=UPI001C9B57A8|nr:DEAD/DEAH box helicase [Curtobacterium sp. TC1]QZQ53598.1 DEAD/DEAH box helicase [Curtobacterium sp. TC1]
MDFDQLANEVGTALPTEPRAVFDSLPGKAQGYGYLRDVQAQILTAWHARRTDRDVIVKVNTGGGKTIDGLIMLQSYLNEGIKPALYVAPDKYLVQQAVDDARNIGLKVVTDPESGAYLAGESIAVVTADRLFNGHTIFSDHRPTAARVPIGAVVIDDAHAVLARLRQKFSITVPRDSASYQELLDLFTEDLKTQSPDTLLDIIELTGSTFARVPFWSVNGKADELRVILRKYKSDPMDFRYDAIRDVIALSRVVFTHREVTIVPPCPPVSRVTSFVEAKHRVFLTATLANDSVLVTDFDADPALVTTPIQPLTAGDIGERLILAPEEINPQISDEDVRSAVKEMSLQHNTLVIVPSDRAMERWSGGADQPQPRPPPATSRTPLSGCAAVSMSVWSSSPTSMTGSTSRRTPAGSW